MGLARHVIVHLVGHHDLYVELAVGPRRVLALHTSHAADALGAAVGRALGAAGPPATGALAATGDRVALAAPAPLGWSAAEVAARLDWRTHEITAEALAAAPLVALRLPLLEAVLAGARAETSAGDARGAAPRIALVLVSVGPTDGVAPGAAGADEATARGTSTEAIAAALAQVLARSALGADLAITHRHLDTATPHRFDGLPALLRTLRADLARQRRDIVAAHPADWASRFRVSLSVTTGPVPVITGLARGMEEFASRLIVIGDARRWPEDDGAARTYVAESLDPHPVRQHPAVDADDVAGDPVIAGAIAAMRAWHTAYVTARPQRAAELVAQGAEAGFWHRKGTQEVLAVIVVRDPDTDALHTFRGVNLEVSLPTGSLCAERNAIGSAVAALPTLQRRHIEAVAVLGLRGPPRLGPCGACTEWLRKMAEANPDLRVISFEDTACTRAFVEPVR